MDIANIFASQGQTEQQVETLEAQGQAKAQATQAKAQQALDTATSTKSTIEEAIGAPLLAKGLNKVMRSKTLRGVFKKAGTSPEELEKFAKMDAGEKLEFLKSKGSKTAQEFADKLASKAKEGVNVSDDVIAKGKNFVNNVAKADAGQDSPVNIDDLKKMSPEETDNYVKANTASETTDIDVENPLFDNTISDIKETDLDNPFASIGGDSSQLAQTGMQETRSFATTPENLLGDEVSDFSSKANDFYNAAKSTVSSAAESIGDFASSVKSGVSDVASAVKSGVSDVATSTGEAVASVLPESVTSAVSATTEAVGTAIAGSQGFIDPITDVIGLLAGLAGVIGGAESTADKAKEIIPTTPEVFSSYTPGI